MKPEVQEKLLWQERPKTLRGMITAAVKIDNRLHEFNLKKKEYRNPAFRPARIFGGHRNGHDKSTTNGNSDPYGPRPMELDATQPKKTLKGTRGTCHYCKKPGHFKADCLKLAGDKKKVRFGGKEIRPTMEMGVRSTATQWRPQTNEYRHERQYSNVRNGNGKDWTPGKKTEKNFQQVDAPTRTRTTSQHIRTNPEY